MEWFNLEGEGIKFLLQDNVLAVLSDFPLQTVSSAFHNGGGIKPTRIILNIEVPKGYLNSILHMDPEALINETRKKMGINEYFVAMITAACVKNYAAASKREDGIGVSVIATAADDDGHTCDHAESAGEEIHAQVLDPGTINIIVIIDANPTESCFVSAIITATEAKTAAMMELDIRSRYSGELATGTITDAIACAHTGRGELILFGGPASKLGQLVASCTRQAVKEAIMKGRECSPVRSLFGRLRARHLSVDKIAEELSKVKSLQMDKSELVCLLIDDIRQNPSFAALLLAAIKLDDDVATGLVPPEFRDITQLSSEIATIVGESSSSKPLQVSEEELAQVNLPIFLKRGLLAMLQNKRWAREN